MRIFRNREDSLKFGLSFFFLAGSILGTLFCNCMTNDMKLGLTAAEHGFITSASLANMDFSALFLRIMPKRLWTLALVFLASSTALSVPLLLAGCGYFGFSTATLICTLTMSAGLKGMLRYLVLVFPQCLMYVPAMYVLLWWMPVHEKRLTLSSSVFLVVLVVCGACLETLVNPWILALFPF